ncbi:MAG TPA: Ig-like domain-containing protein [Hyphomicrobiaceae bacterium]|nr:Ig-like domain-containing protein [Hyphomicrobiaceae bacterium]
MSFGRLGSLGAGFSRMGGGGGSTGDSLAPPAPLSVDLVAASDTGSSSTDNITNDTTPDLDYTFAVALAENDEILTYVDGVLVDTHPVTAGEAGGAAISLGIASPLTAGDRSITIKHNRPSGGDHISAASPALVITVDLTAPTVSSSTPADNATGVLIGSNIAITFSRNIAFHTAVAIAVKKTADDTDFQAFTEADIGTGLTISGAVLTINPTSTLANNVSYYITIGATSIKDALAHNFFAGISDKTVLNFTTEAASFTPADLGASLALWLEADDLTTLFQLNNGTTAVTTTGQSVGTWNDKSGDGFHVNSIADDAARPVYTTGGGAGGTSPYVLFDGSGDGLKRNGALSLLGAATVSIAVRGAASPGTGRNVITESHSANNARYDIIRTNGTTASTADLLGRNSASTVWYAAGGTLTPNAFDATDNVLTIVDNGTSFTTYLDGTQVDTDAYTASGTNTVTLFSLGALWLGAGWIGSSFFGGRIYNVVIVKRAIDATERANLVTYQGNKIGRSL